MKIPKDVMDEINIILIENNDDNNDMQKISHMIPDGLKTEQDAKNNIILAAKGPEDIFMGIVIFKEYSRNMELLWCYVEPEFRRMGICSAIIQRMVDTVKKSDYFIGVCAQYMKYGNEIICEVLRSVGFKVEEQEWPVYTFNLNEAIGLQLFTVNKKMFQENVYSIGDCEYVLKKRFSNKLLVSSEINPIELPIEWEKYDQNLSKVYLESDGQITAIILIEQKKDYMEVAFAYVNDNPYAFPYMIGAIFAEAHSRYKEYPEKVLVTSLDDTIDKLLLYFVPSAKKTLMYYAHIS